MITNEDCIQILKNYLDDDDFNFRSFELKPFSEKVEGFLGEHYNLAIRYERNDHETESKFFVKTKPTKNTAQEEVADKMNIYKREIFMYDLLFKEFKKSGLDVSFAPESYYYITDSAIVMENLLDKGFDVRDRHTKLTPDQLSLSLRALALFHAAGYVYERTKSKELGRTFRLNTEYKEDIVELFYVQFIDPDSYTMNWNRGFKSTFSKIISLLPSETFNRNYFQELLDNYETGKVFVKQTNLAKTCGHGDLWSNNVLFKANGETHTECRLIDFQLSRYFYPCFDVILFLYCNVDQRSENLLSLYKSYHNMLGDILKSYGYSVEEIHPWLDFLRSVRMVLPDALHQVTYTKCLTNLPQEKMLNLLEVNKDGFRDLLFDNSEMIADSFETNEQYRNVVIDAMYDLYNALMQKKLYCDF